MNPSYGQRKCDSRSLIFYKPFGVLSQFTRSGNQYGHKTLADFIQIPGVYPAGRLDYDSEGLLLLTGDGALQHRLTDPRFGHPRTYWVQVEGPVREQSLQQLRGGVEIRGGKSRPCEALHIDAPDVFARDPPIRFRREIPTSWLSIILTEGRNRQVRRMTAAVGLPTLRLIRVAIGEVTLALLQPGEWRYLSSEEISCLGKKNGRSALRL